MTKRRRKPKQWEQPQSEGSAVTKPRKKLRQTAHRMAAANPEVRPLIRVLRGRWKDAPEKERRERVAQLLEKGCTIRGIAEDIGRPESSVRNYAKPGPDSPAREEAVALHEPVPFKGDSTNAVAPPVVQKPGPSSSKAPSLGNHKRLVPRRMVPHPNRPPLAKRPEDKEQDLQSLRDQLTEIIVGFVSARWGIPEMPIEASDLPVFLTSLRSSPAFDRPWIKPVKLPDRISIRDLFLLTEPKPRPATMDWGYKAKWLATILLSLRPDESYFGYWIDAAEGQLLPPPPPADLTVDEFGRPLEASEIIFRQRLRRMNGMD